MGINNMTSPNFTNITTDNEDSVDRVFDITIIVLCTVISIVGVCGNFATLLKIIFYTTYHRAFYTAIACLAGSDLLSIVMQYVRLLFYSSFFEQHHNDHTMEIYFSLLFTVVHSSAGHVVILTCTRYVLIAHPIFYKSRVTPKVLVVVSVVTWVVSIALGIGYGFYNHRYYMGHITPIQDACVQMFLCLYIFVLPVVFFIVSDILQRRSLQKSLLPQSDFIKRKQSAMIFVILVIYTVCLLPYCTIDIFFFLDINGNLPFTIFPSIKKHLVSVGILFIVINYSVNPFVYLHFSRSFGKLHTFVSLHFRDQDLRSKRHFRYLLKKKFPGSLNKVGGETWP